MGYNGRHYLKQFIEGKPIRFGIKQRIMGCSKTGCCFDMNLCEGKQERKFPAGGIGASAILKNVGLVEIPSNHSFYFDNFFTNFELLKSLSEQEVCSCRTVRLNRINKCSLKSEKEIQNQNRGFHDHEFDAENDTSPVVWKDSSNLNCYLTT